MRQRGESEQPVKGRRAAGPKARKFSTAAPSIANLQEQLKEAQEQQAATADVLKALSRSAFDLQKVLDKLTESACRLCEAYDAILVLREDNFLRVAAHCGDIPVFDKWPVSRDWISGRCVVDRKPVHIRDLLSEEAAGSPLTERT